MIDRPTRAVSLTLAVLALWVPAAARADDVRVTADTAFQVYEVRSPGAAAFLARRRLVQTLGLTYVHALGDDRVDRPIPRLSASVTLRLDQELGEDCLVSRDLCYVATNARDPSFYQPLAEDSAIDAPEAWVEVDRLPLGARVRAGRQLHFDPIGLVRLDGASARAAPVAWALAEAYGGLLVRRTSLLGTDAFAPEGIARLDLDDVDPERAPFIAEPTTAWVAGGSIELGHSAYARAQAGFREVRGDDGLVSRRASLSVASQPIEALRLSAAGVLDVHDRRIVDAWAELSVAPIDALAFRLSAERHVPVFDWGSIWPYFALSPIDEGRLGTTVKLTEHLTAGAAARVRHAEIDPGTDETDVGGEGEVSIRALGGSARLWGFVWRGDLGPATAVMLDAVRPLAWWVVADMRASLWHFRDPMREVLEGTSVSEALGVRFRLSDLTSLRLELEHAYSPIVRHRFRGLVTLSVEVWR